MKTEDKEVSYNTLKQRWRREREKKWLKKHGLTSWESLHTKLMKGELTIYIPPKVKEPVT
jgi:hypothetical protein